MSDLARPWRAYAAAAAQTPLTDPVPALIWLARAVLVASTVFTVVFDPRVFFGRGGGGGGWISFTSWFYGGSWWAFRLAFLALVLFGIAALTQRARLALGGQGRRWRPFCSSGVSCAACRTRTT